MQRPVAMRERRSEPLYRIYGEDEIAASREPQRLDSIERSDLPAGAGEEQSFTAAPSFAVRARFSRRAAPIAIVGALALATVLRAALGSHTHRLGSTVGAQRSPVAERSAGRALGEARGALREAEAPGARPSIRPAGGASPWPPRQLGLAARGVGAERDVVAPPPGPSAARRSTRLRAGQEFGFER